MKTRFDLEDEIMKLYVFIDNIDNAVEYLSERNIDPTVVDTISNILVGTSTLMGLHAEKMLDTMSQCFKLDQYKDCIKNTHAYNRNWDNSCTDALNPTFNGDMSYNPDVSELSVQIPLTNDDNRVTTNCSNSCDSSMSSFEYQ
jgi:hypothetical protein